MSSLSDNISNVVTLYIGICSINTRKNILSLSDNISNVLTIWRHSKCHHDNISRVFVIKWWLITVTTYASVSLVGAIQLRLGWHDSTPTICFPDTIHVSIHGAVDEHTQQHNMGSCLCPLPTTSTPLPIISHWTKANRTFFIDCVRAAGQINIDDISPATIEAIQN